MTIGGVICVLTLISAATAAGRLEKPASLRLVAEFLRSPAQDGLEMEYCSPTLQHEVLRYSKSHSGTPLLCLQASQADRSNDEVLDVISVMLKISRISDSIKVVVEDIKWSTSIADIIQLPYESKTLFDSNLTDSPDYKRWEHFLLKKLKLPSSYFRTGRSQETLPRLKRNMNGGKGTSQLLATIEQNINGTLHSVRSLKSAERNITKEFMIVQRKIKRYSSMVDNASADILELQEKGKKVEKRFESVEKGIVKLEEGRKDLKYAIEEFYAQLSAANISQQYRDKEPLYGAKFNGNGYAMMEAPGYRDFFKFIFKFRTCNPDGLLFFSSNDSMDFWYIALVKGKLLFHYKLGIKTELRYYRENYSDDEWHEVKVEATDRLFIIIVDGLYSLFGAPVIPDGFFSVSWGPLYIGGVPDRPFYQKLRINITSFTGSIENIWRHKDKNSSNTSRYDFRDSLGLKNISFNYAKGDKSYYFNGDEYAIYPLPDDEVGENFTLKLQFKTTHPEGVLFTASSGWNSRIDALGLEIKSGVLHYNVVIDDIPIVRLQHPRKKLADNQWHTVLAEKQRDTLRLTVDGHLKSSLFYSTDFFLHTDKALYIGGYPGTRLPHGVTTDKFHGCIEVDGLSNCTLQECTS